MGVYLQDQHGHREYIPRIKEMKHSKKEEEEDSELLYKDTEVCKLTNSCDGTLVQKSLLFASNTQN